MSGTFETAKAPKSCHYPEPLTIPPLRSHKQTFILLHGRGSSASKFGPDLLAASVPQIGTLAGAFPNAKFVFPTASKRRATIYKRSTINQWFDNWALDTPTEREELQIDGLRETSAYIHGLLRREIGLVGAGNVVLGGLSQGCAASLVALLLWDGEPLAAVLGLCGWLPFRKHMEDIARGEESIADIEDEEFNPFADLEEGDNHSDGDHDKRTASEADLSMKAVAYLREELDMPIPPPVHLPFQCTPVFLAHGVEDEKVPVNLVREAASCLSSMATNVSRKEYEGLGHWYSMDMLGDLVKFVRERSSWEIHDDCL